MYLYFSRTLIHPWINGEKEKGYQHTIFVLHDIDLRRGGTRDISKQEGTATLNLIFNQHLKAILVFSI